MKKVIYRNKISKVLGIGLVVFQLVSTSLSAQEAESASSGDPTKGKALFNQNCAACHALDRKMTGPALANVETRLADDEGLDREWLNAWIKNSPGLIKSGDAYANKIYAEYNQAAMTPFPTLSDEDIDHILAYTAAAPEPVAAAAAATSAAGGGEGQASGISNEVILGALVMVFGLLVLMLVMVNKTLQRIATANGVDLAGEKGEKRLPLWKAFAKNQFLVLVTVILLL